MERLLYYFKKPALIYVLNHNLLLRYFRINDPYRLIGLLVISGILFIPAIVDSSHLSIPELRSFLIGEKVRRGAVPFVDIIDATGPLTSWFYGLVDLVMGRSLGARHSVGFLALVSQAIFMGLVFINRKVFSENTFVPSLIFLVFVAFSHDTLALTGELLGMGFLLLALNNLFKELEFRTKSDDTVLALGFFISLASLASFDYSIYFLAAGVIVVLYSRRDLRVFLLLLMGFALPHLLLMAIYFLAGHLEALVQYFYLPNLRFGGGALMSARGLLYLSAVPALYLVASLLMLNREARFSKYQSQVFQSMLIWTAFSVIYAGYAGNLRPQNLITFAPCLSYFVSQLLLLIRRRRVAEWSLWLFLLGIVGISTLARYDKIEEIDYSRLRVSNDKKIDATGENIVVLDEDISWYADNALATPFLDWRLAEPVFSDLDYYENVILISEGFRKDPPDLIADPGNFMPPVFERIPYLKEMYREERAGIYRKND